MVEPASKKTKDENGLAVDKKSDLYQGFVRTGRKSVQSIWDVGNTSSLVDFTVNELYSDLQLVADGITFYTHRVMVAPNSKILDIALKQDPDLKDPTIKIEIKPQLLSIILNWIYREPKSREQWLTKHLASCDEKSTVKYVDFDQVVDFLRKIGGDGDFDMTRLAGCLHSQEILILMMLHKAAFQYDMPDLMLFLQTKIISSSSRVDISVPIGVYSTVIKHLVTTHISLDLLADEWGKNIKAFNLLKNGLVINRTYSLTSEFARLCVQRHSYEPCIFLACVDWFDTKDISWLQTAGKLLVRQIAIKLQESLASRVKFKEARQHRLVVSQLWVETKVLKTQPDNRVHRCLQEILNKTRQVTGLMPLQISILESLFTHPNIRLECSM